MDGYASWALGSSTTHGLTTEETLRDIDSMLLELYRITDSLSQGKKQINRGSRGADRAESTDVSLIEKGHLNDDILARRVPQAVAPS